MRAQFASIAISQIQREPTNSIVLALAYRALIFANTSA
jgi:hypothetical protein